MNPLRNTPQRIIAKLTAWGGKNSHGLPMWRVLRAEDHLVQRAGTWTEFDEEEVQAEFEHLRTEDGQHAHTVKTKQIAPHAVKVGMFWVPKWPVKGWILERWFPASSIMSRQEWDASVSQDGVTPMMGPYPVKGDYWLLDGPWIEIPLLKEIHRVISEYENDPTHTHGRIDPEVAEQAMEAAMRREEERDEAQTERLLQEAEYGRRQTVDFIKANPELAGFYNRAAHTSRVQLGI